jgi:hypothetical protein
MSLNALILEKLQSPGRELVHEKSSRGVERPEANPPRRRKRVSTCRSMLDASFGSTGTKKNREKLAKGNSGKR